MNEEARRERAAEHFGRAYRAQMAGRLEEALQLYRASIDLFPTAEAHTFLGWTYSLQGRLDDAIAECHEAIAIDPDFGNPYNDIGAYLIERGEIDEAIPWLERALAAPRYDSYCFPHTNLGRVYELKRHWSRARTEYGLAIREEPGYRPALEGVARIQGFLN